jgi:hypothetical protein
MAREDDKDSVHMQGVYPSLLHIFLEIGIASMFLWRDPCVVADEVSLANRKDIMANAVIPFNTVFCFLRPVLADVFA